MNVISPKNPEWSTPSNINTCLNWFNLVFRTCHEWRPLNCRLPDVRKKMSVKHKRFYLHLVKNNCWYTTLNCSTTMDSRRSQTDEVFRSFRQCLQLLLTQSKFYSSKWQSSLNKNDTNQKSLETAYRSDKAYLCPPSATFSSSDLLSA